MDIVAYWPRIRNGSAGVRQLLHIGSVPLSKYRRISITRTVPFVSQWPGSSCTRRGDSAMLTETRRQRGGGCVLSLEILGPPRVLRSGQPLRVGRRKSRALLYYIAAH